MSNDVLNNQRMYSEGGGRKQEDQKKTASNVKTGEGGITLAKRIALFKRQGLVSKVKC